MASRLGAGGWANIFLGRFFRTFAGIPAGANRMPWARFLVFNALGGEAIAWTTAVGLGAYALRAHPRSPTTTGTIGFTSHLPGAVDSPSDRPVLIRLRVVDIETTGFAPPAEVIELGFPWLSRSSVRSQKRATA